MIFESITLHRTDTHAYQVTIWSDGVVRWNGRTASRMGAWQAMLDADWLDALSGLLADLPSPGRKGIADGESLVVETSKGRMAYELTRRAVSIGVWHIGMLIDGMCVHSQWSPLDVSEGADFSPWASGHWMTFVQGAARGQALARPEGLLLLAGSTASTSTAPTLEDVYKTTRAELLDDGGLVLVGDVLVLTRHLLFSSPSAPACVLAATNTNGRRAWRDASGASWAQLGLS